MANKATLLGDGTWISLYAWVRVPSDNVGYAAGFDDDDEGVPQVSVCLVGARDPEWYYATELRSLGDTR